jgi:hypothetical protein
MPNTQRNGDITTVTLSPEEESQIRQFEKKALEANTPVAQYGGSVMIGGAGASSSSSSSNNNNLQLYRLIKRIGSHQESEILAPSSTRIIIDSPELHRASSDNAEKNTNLILRNLMKKIVNK